MTTKYTKEQREKALNILTDEGYFEVMTLEDFMTAYEPYQIARKVKGSDLTLECNYLRINGYYSNVEEADEMTDLITDDEVAEVMEDLPDNSSLLELDTSRHDNEVYTKATAENSPLYLGTLKLIKGFWYLVGAGENGYLVAAKIDTYTREATLNVLNEELSSLSPEQVHKLNELNTVYPGNIISFLVPNPILWYDLQ